MSGFEQEPITNFRRDPAADDEFRLRVDELVADLLRRERIVLAWAVRRLSVGPLARCIVLHERPDIVLQAADVLAGRIAR